MQGLGLRALSSAFKVYEIHGLSLSGATELAFTIAAQYRSAQPQIFVMVSPKPQTLNPQP